MDVFDVADLEDQRSGDDGDADWKGRAEEAEERFQMAKKAQEELMLELQEMKEMVTAASVARIEAQNELGDVRSRHSDEIENKEVLIRELKDKLSFKTDEVSENDAFFRTEIEEVRSSLTSKKKENENLKNALKEAEDRIEIFQREDKSNQIEILEEKLELMANEKEESLRATKELIEENSQLLEKVDQLKLEVFELKSKVEENECEMIGYQQNLNQLKTDMNQMHSELSEAHFNPDAQEKQGNSLFSEVDDRRQIVEAQLVKFKDKFEAIKVHLHQRSQQLAKARISYIPLNVRLKLFRGLFFCICP